MQFVFWERYTRRRIYFLNGQSDHDTRPLEEHTQKKKPVFMQQSSAYTGPQEELANWADTRFTKSATGSSDATYEDWRQRHLEVQRGDFPQAISRSLNPLTVKLHLVWPRVVCPSLRPLSCRCFLKHPGADWLLSVVTLLVSLKFTLSLLKPSRHLSHRLGHLSPTLRPSSTSNEALSPT